MVATQNPQSGDLGTFPLVGGQRDRFSVSLSMGLPGREAELRVLAGTGGDHALALLMPTADLAVGQRLRHQLNDVYVHPPVASYTLDLVDTVRSRTSSRPPLSTRWIVGAVVALIVAGVVTVLVVRRRRGPEPVERSLAEALVVRIEAHGTAHGQPRRRSETIVAYTRQLGTPRPPPGRGRPSAVRGPLRSDAAVDRRPDRGGWRGHRDRRGVPRAHPGRPTPRAQGPRPTARVD